MTNKALLLKAIYFLLFSVFILLSIGFFGINLIGGFLLIGSLLYLIFSRNKNQGLKRQDYLVLALLFVLFLVVSKKISDYQISVVYIPVIALVMLVSILYNDFELSFIFCILASCFAGLIAGGSLYLCLIFLITAIAALLLARQLRKRSGILNVGLYAGLIQMLIFIMVFRVNFKQALPNLFSGVLCGVVVIAALAPLENLFEISTNFGLLELSDFNHPLLRKMILEAPGTYHHSLIVGNIAEAAAQAIGANSLLTRIGAYYHDIGKLEKAEYFLENQRDASRHSGLNPSISKMVIMNHIAQGVELAKKYRLKPAIVDFITQHHGTSLVYYFYRRALEEIEDEQIQEEGFRYPGPKPTTKETAIVLLADSVEAASRVMTNGSNSAKIEDLVHKVINNKFIDAQLDNCNLTLKDLEEIAKVFTRMLGGIYHGRIKYPTETKDRNIHKKHDAKFAASDQTQDKKSDKKDF